MAAVPYAAAAHAVCCGRAQAQALGGGGRTGITLACGTSKLEPQDPAPEHRRVAPNPNPRAAHNVPDKLCCGVCCLVAPSE
jgi:hypothetical protein